MFGLCGFRATSPNFDLLFSDGVNCVSFCVFRLNLFFVVFVCWDLWHQKFVKSFPRPPQTQTPKNTTNQQKHPQKNRKPNKTKQTKSGTFQNNKQNKVWRGRSGELSTNPTWEERGASTPGRGWGEQQPTPTIPHGAREESMPKGAGRVQIIYVTSWDRRTDEARRQSTHLPPRPHPLLSPRGQFP